MENLFDYCLESVACDYVSEGFKDVLKKAGTIASDAAKNAGNLIITIINTIINTIRKCINTIKNIFRKATGKETKEFQKKDVINYRFKTSVDTHYTTKTEYVEYIIRKYNVKNIDQMNEGMNSVRSALEIVEVFISNPHSDHLKLKIDSAMKKFDLPVIENPGPSKRQGAKYKVQLMQPDVFIDTIVHSFREHKYDTNTRFTYDLEYFEKKCKKLLTAVSDNNSNIYDEHKPLLLSYVKKLNDYISKTTGDINKEIVNLKKASENFDIGLYKSLPDQ